MHHWPRNGESVSSTAVAARPSPSERQAAQVQPHPKTIVWRPSWILGPVPDLSLIIGSPVIIYLLITVAESFWTAATVSSIAMIWAVGHHLPGMMRAYGDPELFLRYRLRFLIAPLFLLVICCSSFVFGLSGTIAIASVWGWWHYLMQSYGFVRIYDAKTGSSGVLTRWLDWTMCLTWFGSAIVLNDNALFGFVNNFHNCGLRTPSAEFFATAKLLAKSAVIVITAVFFANYLRNRFVGIRSHPAKLLLMVTTFGCFWYSTATVTQIVVAYAIFELFHDVQYLTIVWAFNRNRVRKDESLGGITRFLFRPRIALVLLYLMLVFAYGSLDYGSRLISQETVQRLFLGCFLTSAILHYYFDGFIWKLREKKTKSTLGIDSVNKPIVQPRTPGMLRHGLLWALFVFVLLGLTYSELSNRILFMQNAHTIQSRIATESKTWAQAMPNSYMANYYAGLASEGEGNYTAARAGYQRALSIFPEHVDALAGLERLRDSQNAIE